jgi:hypothetical protein
MSQPAALTAAPAAATAPIAWNARVEPPHPDHYAMITPEGRIEVSQLAEHGLYRAARYAPVMAYTRNVDAPPAASPPPVAPAAAPAPPAPAPDRQVLVYDTTEAPNAQAPAQPQLADASGGARMIDVSAELAAR